MLILLLDDVSASLPLGLFPLSLSHAAKPPARRESSGSFDELPWPCIGPRNSCDLKYLITSAAIFFSKNLGSFFDENSTTVHCGIEEGMVEVEVVEVVVEGKWW